jgi:hypothetical protein
LVFINGIGKSFILKSAEAALEIAVSKKLRINRSQVGMSLETRIVVDVFLKVRSFKAWQCNGKPVDFRGSTDLPEWHAPLLSKTEYSEW